MLAHDLSGQRFGWLVAVSRADNHLGRTAWRCRCDCGAEPIVMVYQLRGGTTRSCGCLRRAVTSMRVARHRMTGTTAHNTWCNIRQRCRATSGKSWRDYGSRGITVCARWETFENFLADMGEPPPGMSIDRIDNDGNYEPGNCRWATPAEQAANRRNTARVVVDGEAVLMSELAARTGIPRTTLRRHIAKYGVDAALSQTNRRFRQKDTH